jgi:uracil-DNA glycosylase
MNSTTGHLAMNTEQIRYLHAMGIQTWQLKMTEPGHRLMVIVDKPFTDRERQLFNAMLEAVGVDVNRVYMIDSILSSDSITREIKKIQPVFILATGQTTANFLLNNDLPLETLRKTTHSCHSLPLVVTYHPNDLMQEMVNKKKAFLDLQTLNHSDIL